MSSVLVREGLRTPKTAREVQYAALPYRETNGAIEVLLITSLRSRRWIVPKGWPIEGCSPPECAALEALEEAGVVGEVGKRSIGSFRYTKHRKSGCAVPCRVEVFSLKVSRQRQAWREKALRETRWLPLVEAAAAVSESELRRLLLKFGAQFPAQKSIEIV
jgi:8-oxo-dGTP pyrophosphatase MutT (NUDIX family)